MLKGACFKSISMRRRRYIIMTALFISCSPLYSVALTRPDFILNSSLLKAESTARSIAAGWLSNDFRALGVITSCRIDSCSYMYWAAKWKMLPNTRLSIPSSSS